MGSIFDYYDNKFGYVKSFFAFVGAFGAGCGVLIFVMINLGKMELNQKIIFEGFIPCGIMFMVGLFVYISTLRQLHGYNPVILALAMIFSGFLTGIFLGFILMFGILKIFSNGASSSEAAGWENAKAEEEAARAGREAEDRALAARREVAKREAMRQFGAQAGEVTVNTTGDWVKVGEDWHKVVEK